MNNFCQLARQSLAHYLNQGTVMKDSRRVGYRAGCFVSLHSPDGALRGCIGTISPVEDDLVSEIIQNAVSCGTRDPRFPPVSPSELPDLKIEVSVLKPPQPILNLSELDHRRYGVVVEQGHKRGVLLPDLEGVDSVEQQLAITKRKASIFNNDPLTISRFEVEKHHESPQPGNH